MVAEEVCDSKMSLAQLAEPIMLYPQYMKNVRVKDKAAVMADKNVQKALEGVEKLINKNGRALLRQSGTEPVIRVMIESESEEKCKEYAEIIVKAILDGGHGVG
jgi:phosphoglucosamine mutase